ncbi:MAG: hypothetical protein LUD29_00595 [Clostridia bacterium]|nr:hypothetical protein [Clostridia bacterium]
MKNTARSFMRGGVSLLVVMSLVCGCGTLFFTGCKTKKSGIDTVSLSGMDVYYLTTADIDFGALTLDVMYDDGTSETLRRAEFDIDDKDIRDDTDFILNTSGLYETAVKGGEMEKGEYRISVSIPSQKYSEEVMTVKVGDDYRSDLTFLSYDAPGLLSTYNTNLNEHTGSAAEDSFYGKGNGYFVGDDNGFEFKPVFFAEVKSTGELGSFSGFDKDISVSLKDSSLNADLNLSENDYVSVDGFTFDFTEEAIGRTFTIEVSKPKGYETNDYGQELCDYSLDVTVADGWNVTSAMDLGMMNIVSNEFNRSDFVSGDDEKSRDGGEPVKYFWDKESETYVAKYTYEIWDEYLTGNGYDTEPVNGIFLHSDITITENDIPGDFLISKEEAEHYGYGYDELIGTIRDGSKLYEKNLEDADFTFNGNFFTVNCHSLRWAMSRLNNQSEFSYFPENYSGSRTGCVITIFGVQGLTDPNTTMPRYSATFENINARGNAIDASDVEGEAAGSPSLIESRSAETKIENCIVKEFLYAFRAFNSDESYVNLEIDDTKVFDCYFSAIRIARAARNEVTNSELRRFSGSVIMQMSATEEEELCGAYYEAGVTIDDKTEMENKIDGTEAWFVSAGASGIATYISLADSVVRTISGGTRTVLDENNKINLLTFAHDTEDFGRGGTKLNINFSIGDGVPFILNESTDLEPNGEASEELKADKGLYNAAATNYFIDNVPSQHFLPLTFSDEKGEICAIDMSMTWSFDPVWLSNQGCVVSVEGAYDRQTNNTGHEVDLSSDAELLYIYYDMGGVGLGLVVSLYTL